MFQRATLAEKEVSTLKEQLSNNQNIHVDVKDGNMDRHTYENEIAAKDKEVSKFLSIFF